MVENLKMSEVVELRYGWIAPPLSPHSSEEEGIESCSTFPMENNAMPPTESVALCSNPESGHSNAHQGPHSVLDGTSNDNEENDNEEEYGEVEYDTEEEEEDEEEEEEEEVEISSRSNVMGFQGGIARSRSVTDEDMEELRGCIDLGFGFCQNESVNLKTTLPALEIYYAITRQYHDMKTRSPSLSCTKTDPTSVLERTSSGESYSSLNSDTWRISSPGESTNRVKTRLRHWAQAVACSLKECL